MLSQGIGGRVSSDLAFATHCASVSVCMYCRRLTAYVVPQGPRQPSRSPASQSFSGTLPLVIAYPAVWQSLQPPIVTRYLPRASELASAFAPGAFAASAACTAHGSVPAKTMVISRAAKSNLMHPSVLFSKLRIENLPARDWIRATARALIHQKDATPSAA